MGVGKDQGFGGTKGDSGGGGLRENEAVDDDRNAFFNYNFST